MKKAPILNILSTFFQKHPFFYNSSTHTKLIANLCPKMYPIFENSSTPFQKITLFLHIKCSRTCLEKQPNFREILHDHAYTTLKLSDDTGRALDITKNAGFLRKCQKT